MATEDPIAPVAAPAEAATPAAKGKKVKEPKAKKPAAPKKSTSHPAYLEMIGEAITSLKDRTGSSQYAIAKFIEDKHKAQLAPNFKKLLLVQLKKLTAGGKLTKIKASYKLPSSAAKKPATALSLAAKSKAKAPVAVKPKAKVAARPKAAPAKVKAPAKKAAKPARAAKTTVKALSAKKAAKSKVPAPAKKKVAKPKVKSVKKVGKSPAAKKAKK